MDKIITPQQFIRIANNFYNQNNLEVPFDRVALDSHYYNYINQNLKIVDQQYKVAFVFICLSPLYWQYAPEMVRGAKEFFLPGHNTDFFFWTDIPEDGTQVNPQITKAWKERGQKIEEPKVASTIEAISKSIIDLRGKTDINIIPTDMVEWPYPTLLRYNLFLQQEEKLKTYDYVFYCDIDMRFVNVVGDEILGQGITAAQHPMYALRKEYWPPYEPNPNSASYIKRPGQVVKEDGQSRFMPLYFAGGFQGGKSDKFIEAMKDTKKLIEKDMQNNYIPIWNDETAWNKYLSENPPEIVLSPSYVYPDSLVKEYYEPIWGKNYQPKLMTLTKWFTTSTEGGTAVQKIISDNKKLK